MEIKALHIDALVTTVYSTHDNLTASQIALSQVSEDWCSETYPDLGGSRVRADDIWARDLKRFASISTDY